MLPQNQGHDIYLMRGIPPKLTEMEVVSLLFQIGVPVPVFWYVPSIRNSHQENRGYAFIGFDPGGWELPYLQTLIQTEPTLGLQLERSTACSAQMINNAAIWDRVQTISRQNFWHARVANGSLVAALQHQGIPIQQQAALQAPIPQFHPQMQGLRGADFPPEQLHAWNTNLPTSSTMSANQRLPSQLAYVPEQQQAVFAWQQQQQLQQAQAFRPDVQLQQQQLRQAEAFRPPDVLPQWQSWRSQLPFGETRQLQLAHVPEHATVASTQRKPGPTPVSGVSQTYPPMAFLSDTSTTAAYDLPELNREDGSQAITEPSRGSENRHSETPKIGNGSSSGSSNSSHGVRGCILGNGPDSDGSYWATPNDSSSQNEDPSGLQLPVEIPWTSLSALPQRATYAVYEEDSASAEPASSIIDRSLVLQL